MASAWIQHVQKYAKDNNVKYSEALKKAGASYKKGSPSKTKPGEKDFTTKKRSVRKTARKAYEGLKK